MSLHKDVLGEVVMALHQFDHLHEDPLEVARIAAAAERKRILNALVNEGYLRSTNHIEPAVRGRTDRTRHGSCCYCPQCGYQHDDCVCWHNTLLDIIEGG
jgi:hypothetical protein